MDAIDQIHRSLLAEGDFPAWAFGLLLVSLLAWAVMIVRPL